MIDGHGDPPPAVGPFRFQSRVFMQPWQHLYDPAGNLWLSSLIALLPIAFFFVALAVLRMKGWLAGTITVAIALSVALLFYRMPVPQALGAVPASVSSTACGPSHGSSSVRCSSTKFRSRPGSSTSSGPRSSR